ncbi:MAG TPA: hypothetical protein VJO12_01875 [Stellaceae bacterium]|nr:hypothetical protein [Stellaceae bacterium]
MPHRPLFTLIAAAVLGAGLAGEAHGAGGGEAVQFHSASYADFRQVFRRDTPPAPATVSATLTFPDSAAERYPAVVVVHTIGGYQSRTRVGTRRSSARPASPR